ncbi:P2 family phage major capsid protein [Pseudomonas umsongensis]|uniref:P2 family phage major capsid protein n=1 Tax=Pseudomonas umsongensis TaxID=198618 RepID=UPI003D7FF79B
MRSISESSQDKHRPPPASPAVQGSSDGERVQKATLRRFIKDEPMINQVGDYQSLNEAYVIEDYGLVALVENIEFVHQTCRLPCSVPGESHAH